MGPIILVAMLAAVIALLVWPAISARIERRRREAWPGEATVHSLEEMRARKQTPSEQAPPEDARDEAIDPDFRK
jgi:hypothetical protein